MAEVATILIEISSQLNIIFKRLKKVEKHIFKETAKRPTSQELKNINFHKTSNSVGSSPDNQFQKNKESLLGNETQTQSTPEPGQIAN